MCSAITLWSPDVDRVKIRWGHVTSCGGPLAAPCRGGVQRSSGLELLPWSTGLAELVTAAAAPCNEQAWPRRSQWTPPASQLNNWRAQADLSTQLAGRRHRRRHLAPGWERRLVAAGGTPLPPTLPPTAVSHSTAPTLSTVFKLLIEALTQQLEVLVPWPGWSRGQPRAALYWLAGLLAPHITG